MTPAKTIHPGCFFLVVGPSGAGKDSLMDGARARLPRDQFVFAKRVITRPPGMVGEDYVSCDPNTFVQKKNSGEFLVTWQAHGYYYGLESSLHKHQQRGKHIVANGSRAMVGEISSTVENLVVVLVTAPIDLLAKRLAKRGRETETEIQKRLTRESLPFPDHVEVLTVSNDASLEAGIERFVSAVTTRAESASPWRAQNIE